MLCVPPGVYQASLNKNTVLLLNRTINAFPVVHKIYTTELSFNTYISIENIHSVENILRHILNGMAAFCPFASLHGRCLSVCTWHY